MNMLAIPGRITSHLRDELGVPLLRLAWAFTVVMSLLRHPWARSAPASVSAALRHSSTFNR